MNGKMPQNKNNFRNKIEKLYYNYGKFCASHPILILAGVISVIIISCYPLLNTSFHSNTPFHQRKILIRDLDSMYSDDKKLIGYVQQIIVQNHAVLLESDNHNPIEVVYEALSECFTVINEIKNREDYLEACLETGDINVDDKSFNLFPTFSCLILSPLQLWETSTDKFWSDGNILRTINSQKRFIKEMMFGLPWLKTGISSVFTKRKNHKINFAVTFLLKKYNKKFLDDLFQKLKSKYNITVHEPMDSGEEILYNDKTYLSSHLPLLIAYLILMLYVYFSVRKIEMVKSKLGLAFSACFTVAASLYMSLGICIYIGIIVPSLPGSEIFPYLVVIIGLENTLVITKSVVATPVDLPVKHRIAQGLEKEGWAISKNLISEILILSLGIFTFNPAIQEFFLLALIGLSTDFFLQITFFVTVLSIDMRRMELSDIRNCYQNQLLNSINEESSIDWHLGKYNRDGFIIYLFRWIKDQIMSFGNHYLFKENLEKSKLSKGHKRKASDINTAAFIQSDGMVPVYIPRRLIFLYFWAKNRIFQRLVMIVAAVWILFIILYSTNLFHSVFLKNIISLPLQADIQIDLTDDWKLLAMHHWPRLAQIYSINITNRKLFVLPSWNILNYIKISPKTLVAKEEFSKFQTNNWLSNQILSGTNELFMQIPSSLRGWADLSLTFKMVLASIVGMGIVLMSTALIMALFQALQSLSGDNREPVLRILPLKIDTEFAVPPGANCISCGPIIMANGIELSDDMNVAFKIKSWNIDTGKLLEEKFRKGVWDIVFIGNCWVVLGFDSGIVELWRRTTDTIKLFEVDTLNLTRGGIVKMIYWINENCVYAATIDGWMIALTVRNNKIHILHSTKVFLEAVKDFHVSNNHKMVICSSKSIKIFQLPSFNIIESLSLISEPILASHFVDSFQMVH